MRETGKGERRKGREERDPETNGPPERGVWAGHLGLGAGSCGSGWVSHPFPLRSLEEEPRGLLRAGSRRCFPTPGVVAVEECERALRNLVDTRNLSGE